jgi:hypothetical protein
VPKVVCTLLNPPRVANGVAFAEEGGQMVSQELSEADAAYFALVPGYEAWVPPAAPTARGAKGPAPQTSAA